ncbi:hypothetical protein E4J49_02100 [Vibrio parahaemolyticus]|nr:hypothetical protein [Vibrio parahaemolyticus]EGQ8383410.1 hypothetical protein [Vibrio parahaemolyticus]EGQ9124239.1 hypothetical protein [Vibrio parahaemolyticus]EGQ9451652.1 hypothetical protein [Vibrio parahaemolyticus]EGQ9542627.1 hypothetical protein [Vibrio parahaemolyticus]
MKHIKIKMAVRIKELHLETFYRRQQTESQKKTELRLSLRFDGQDLFDKGRNCVFDRALIPFVYTNRRNALTHV